MIAVLLQVGVNGLLLGGLYAAVAAGFSLVWGVLNIVNILHGSAIVVGSYIAFFAWTVLGLHPFLAAPLAALLLGGLGWCVQRFLVARVVEAPVLVTLVMTFALDLVLNNAMIAVFSADYRKIDGAGLLPPLSVGPVSVAGDRLLAAVLAITATLAVHAALTRSRLGRAVVAVRMDRDTARLMGIRVDKVYALTFGIGMAMAGVAGCLLAAVFPVSPLGAQGYLNVAFVACVLGGLGSLVAAVAGGLLLGVAESFGAMVFGAEYSTTVAAVLLIGMLLWRPQGLLGRAGYE